MRTFWIFYAIALFIPVALVLLGLFVPTAFGLQDLADYFPLLFQTMEAHDIQPRGAALAPMIQVALANPVFWTINIFAAAPTIAAVLTAGWRFGIDGLTNLLDRLKPWRAGIQVSDGLRWWGIMILTLLLLKLSEFALNLAFGLETNWIWGVELISATFLWFYLNALLFDQGGLLEETGWRGFALPLLQKFYSPMRAAVVLGLLWAAWHLPREATIAYDSVGQFLSSQASFFVVSVYLTIIIHFFFNKVGGSTLMAIAVHGLSNDSVGLSGGDVSGSSYLIDLCHTIPYVVIGSLVIYFGGKELGYQPEHS